MKRKLYLFAIMSAATLCICGCKETKKISTETQNEEVEKESETETEKLEEETQTEASNIIESESQQEEVTSLNQELLSYNLLSLYINEINKSDNGYEINADVYEAMLIKCDEAENLSEGSILEFGDNTLVVEEIERAINNDYRSVTLSDVNEDIYQYYFEIDGNYDFVDKNGVKFYCLEDYDSSGCVSYKVFENHLIHTSDDTSVAMVESCMGYNESAGYTIKTSEARLDLMKPQLNANIISMADFYSIVKDMSIYNPFRIEMDDMGNITYMEEGYMP